MRELKSSEIHPIKIHGRCSQKNDQIALFWTASGIEVNCSGRELWLEVEVDYDVYEPWVSVLYNGERISRQMLVKGRYWLPVFRNMKKSEVKNVRWMKDVQAMSGDLRHSLIIHQLRLDGELFPLENKPYRIEFIGDSITSGEGLIGAKHEGEWVSMWFDSNSNYTYLCAKALHADYRVISQSGWGVYCSWEGDVEATLSKGYEKICGVVSGDDNQELGASDRYDFSSWETDAVVINLGTNDGGAFTSKGELLEEDSKHFQQAVVSFLKKLRKYNPNAYLLWAYGMLGKVMEKSLQEAIDSYRRISEDKKVAYFELPEMDEEGVGARSHPGKIAHEKAAEALSHRLRELLS